MGRKILLAGLIVVSVCGVTVLRASASTPKPTITSFFPSSTTVGTEVTIKGTNLAGATKVTFNGTTATVVSDAASMIKAYVPVGATTGYINVKTPGGKAMTVSEFKVAPSLVGATSVASDDLGYCVPLTSSGVDCWGYGADGQLGDGHTSASSTPVAVEAVGGTGRLTAVKSLIGGGYNNCALLTSGGVDCWGLGDKGDLGDGSTSNSATPEAVEGVGGTGRLTNVTTLVTSGIGYCALLTMGKVDCWGSGYGGELGDGSRSNSATPEAVEGVGGTGRLSGATNLVSDGLGSVCAVLNSGGVDSWGYGENGELGDGKTSHSATPVAVEGVGGTSTLTGVSSLVSSNGFNLSRSYCAVLTSGGVDCWGYGQGGDLGDGSFSGSTTPVNVEGVGGAGTLSGVSSLVSGYNGYCAVLLSTGGVDCWGYGEYGGLGNGTFYLSRPYGSAVPVAVLGVGGSGTLNGVSSLVAGGGVGYCALLTTSGGVDCWGHGADGELGDGITYNKSPYGSAIPVTVDGVAGTGTLSGVTSMVSYDLGYCAVLTSSGVDCWGYGMHGTNGNGTASIVNIPAEVG